MKASTDRFGQTAADIMQTDMLTVSDSTRLTELAALLGEHQIGGVPVTDEAGHITGVVSLRDVVAHFAGEEDVRPGSRYVLAANAMNDEVFEFAVPEESVAVVSDVMTAQVYSVDQHVSISALARRMVELKVHRLLVTDKNGRHVGLVSAFDVLRAIGGEGLE